MRAFTCGAAEDAYVHLHKQGLSELFFVLQTRTSDRSPTLCITLPASSPKFTYRQTASPATGNGVGTHSLDVLTLRLFLRFVNNDSMDPWGPGNGASHFACAAASAIEPGRKQDLSAPKGTGIKPGVSTPGRSGPTCTEVPKGRRHSAGLQAAAAARACLRPFGTLGGDGALFLALKSQALCLCPCGADMPSQLLRALPQTVASRPRQREGSAPSGRDGISGDRLPGAEALFRFRPFRADRRRAFQGDRVRGFGLKAFP